MRLSLVGMSGSGKSYWSKKLSKSGFRRFCCDDMIAAKLELDLGKKHGSIGTVGRWMGFPFEPQYKEREAKYLTCETDVMSKILDELGRAGDRPGKNIVVDTTGSVIYTSEAILAKLRESTIIVHLSTPLEIQKAKLESYIQKPRPVLWRDLFMRRPDETNEQALARCYPLLLASRETQYERLAHVTMSYYRHRSGQFGVEEFLRDAGVGVT